MHDLFHASQAKLLFQTLQSVGPIIATYSICSACYNSFVYMCRLFNSFTMETILATAFGRRVNVLMGESSELSKQIDIIISGITDGQVDGMIMLESKELQRNLSL